MPWKAKRDADAVKKAAKAAKAENRKRKGHKQMGDDDGTGWVLAMAS